MGHIAKCMKPVLTEEASEMLADEYANLRANDFESGVARTQPVTARALETLIRLSTAHAKARLSKLVEAEDAELAIQLVQFAYFKMVLDKPGRKRSQDGSDSEEEENEERSADTPSKKKRVDPEAEAMLEVEAPPASVELDQDRYKQFMQLLHKCCAEKNQAQSLEIEVIRAFFSKSEKKKPFNNAEIDACIDKMADENKVMRSDDTVFII